MGTATFLPPAALQAGDGPANLNRRQVGRLLRIGSFSLSIGGFLEYASSFKEIPLEEIPEVVAVSLRVAHQPEINHLMGLPLF